MATLIDTKDMPLRLVVETFVGADQWKWERLECGHSERQRHSGLGYRTTARRRRCWQCAHGRPVERQP
jgi:hypothetical protein